MFSVHQPVIDADFWNRRTELEKLRESVERLERGKPPWIAILGERKIGKTSLLRELERRCGTHRLLFAVIDTFEAEPVSSDIFRVLALRVVDRAFAVELGVSFESLIRRPAELRAELHRSDRIASLPAAVRGTIYDLVDRPMDASFLRDCLDLPEQIATALDVHIFVAIDEFQELAAIGTAGHEKAEIIPLLRALWQRHRRVGYLISGSERTMLLELLTSRESPFFQHFDVMDLGPFARPDAISLLTSMSASERPISEELATKAVDVLGGHPFYLQLFGHSIAASSSTLDEGSLKEALGELVFSRTGRLALHFTSEHQRMVGRSAVMAAILDVLTAGPKRLSEIASELGTTSAAARTYLGRLGDSIAREGLHYRLRDPVFGLWLSWRGPGGAAIPMKTLGDDAEAMVAEKLARMGFDLVYQSRASRGAFDLLALRSEAQLGIQVKRTRLPASVRAAEWKRMAAEAGRLGWDWCIAVVTPPPEARVLFLDPARIGERGGARLREGATISNLLLWIDETREAKRRRPPQKRKRKRTRKKKS